MQNTGHVSSRRQVRAMGKVICLLSHLSPLQDKYNYAYSRFLRTVKAFKSNILILFPDFGGFPSGVIFDPFISQRLNHLTWLSLLIAFKNDFIHQPPPSGCPMTSPLELSSHLCL